MESQDPKAASLILKFKEAAKAAEEIDDYDSEDDEEDDDEEEVVSSGFGVERNGQVLKKKKELVGSGGKKRATVAGSGGCMAAPCCQVENCGADLTEAKRYYRRHKVCEVHAKSPLVVVDGIQQRFCQQCSRFHELSEFDEMRRSCRSRLAGHNERRRKLSSETHREEASSRQGSSPRLKENERRVVDDEGGRISVAHQAKHIQFR